MAIVAEKSKNTPVDKKLNTPNRTISGSPTYSITPLYTGEIVQDTTTGSLWYALSLAIDSWSPAVIKG